MAGSRTRLEDRLQAFARDRTRMARAFQIAYWISMLVVIIGAALAIAHYARAAPGVPESTSSAWVILDGTRGAWNGESGAVAENGSALVWLPADARLHAVVVRDASGADAPASWRAEGPSAIRIASGNVGASAEVRAIFDLPSPAISRLAEYEAPQDIGALDINVTAPEGKAVQLVGGARPMFAVAAGTLVSIRVIDADAIGELPLLVTLLIVAVLVLIGTLAWHALRPPAPRDRTQMRFLDHLGELQARLVPPVLVFAFLNIFYFVAGLRLIHVGRASVVVPWLTDTRSISQQGYEALADRLVPSGVELVAIRPIDAVLAQVQIALFLAFVSVLPLLVYELVVFIGPALRDRERKLALRILPAISLLFAVGALFGYLLMAPLMLRTLYAYAPTVGAHALLVVGDLVSFALLVVASFGLAFELPVVMFALARLGVVKARTFRKYFRHAIIVIFVVAGIITPDPSVVSQLLVGVPVTVLYLVGMVAASWGERAQARKRAAAHPS